MNLFKKFIGCEVIIELMGCGSQSGILVDTGYDAVVLKQEQHYQYIAAKHIQFMEPTGSGSENKRTDHPDGYAATGLSLIQLLTHARSLPSLIRLDRHQFLYGTVTAVYEDYFEFEAVGNGKLIVPAGHLKWISPLVDDQHWFPPADPQPLIDQEQSPPTYNGRLLASQGFPVALDLGLAPHKYGILMQSDYPFLKLKTADGKTIHYNAEHIKCLAIMKKPASNP
ncbi:hypothetical protein [Paenibacillus radicis (ex Gao et al. 2016)]|uniref:Uncharacterized protein n=1 Tax=Paenibacillus radicis (ex Gao et al. 2016) TaxID=1737354 RepID=A0A917M4Y8_9BACL|nr:hypothetical protein [Paenibacillus radicis (ex Gao et al. 2016)]GGG77602.1 hypothetical protein GCM10010918_37920 [Paenibacillus radicis (ex Gao et al. 2016)]